MEKIYIELRRKISIYMSNPGWIEKATSAEKNITMEIATWYKADEAINSNLALVSFDKFISFSLRNALLYGKNVISESWDINTNKPSTTA